MLTAYDTQGQGLVRRGGIEACAGAVWIDLLNPGKEDEAAVERLIGIGIPTREEMREIETSSRLYQDGGAQYMTAMLLYQVETPAPIATDVTFILTDRQLVTVRYADMKSFPLFLSRAEKGDAWCDGPVPVLVGLLETIIDRCSDLIERMQGDTERIAQGIFDMKGGQATRSRRFDVLLKQIGREGENASKTRESLKSITRMLTYLSQVATDRREDERVHGRIRTELQDVHSLSDQVAFLQVRIQFLLDASLGLVSIEQNQIIKLFSVAAVMLMPPTLVASVYGMNFKSIPEFDWPYGYAWALGLMLLSALLPFLYFRKKGWL